jgi:excisionase family DNA binding protein
VRTSSRGTIPRVEEDTYTTGQAAKILKVSDSYIRRLVRSGELEAVQDDNGRYLIPQRVIHAMLEGRRADALDLSEPPTEAAELRRRLGRPPARARPLRRPPRAYREGRVDHAGRAGEVDSTA